jgi:renalase
MAQRIAIVGAGLSGISAARVLRDAGREVVVFEKSRGIGGRLATRRTEFGAFDHGAQYFTARSERFRRLLETWTHAGQARPWFEGGHVGTPAMNAPARALAAELDIRTERTVQRLSREEAGWLLHGPAGGAPEGPFAAVLLAMPAPQALTLANTAGAAFPGMRAARMAPCWALLLAYDAPIVGLGTHARLDDDVVAWVAANGSKPGRKDALATYVVHATPTWSRANLELAPDEAGAKLHAAVTTLFPEPGAPRYAAAHRWRYALVEQAAEADHLWDDRLALGACGDWCLGPRVESAFLSGEALARRVLGVAD